MCWPIERSAPPGSTPIGKLEKAPWQVALRCLLILETELGARSDDANGFADFMLGAVDMPESALLQPLSECVVFFVSDVLVSLVEQLHSAMQPASVIEAGINGRMVVQILAIID